jgi:hypothetical protein
MGRDDRIQDRGAAGGAAAGWGGGGVKDVRKHFFFEKKKQKNFIPLRAGLSRQRFSPARSGAKSFLLLFFKKEVLACLLFA